MRLYQHYTQGYAWGGPDPAQWPARFYAAMTLIGSEIARYEGEDQAARDEQAAKARR